MCKPTQVETKARTIDLDTQIVVVQVPKSRPTLCNLMDCSMLVSSVLHYLLEFAQIHVGWIGDAI